VNKYKRMQRVSLHA